MIGIDTNVLVRVILEKDSMEAVIARNFLIKIARQKKAFVASYTILEVAWVLKVSKKSREQIHEAIMNIIESPGILIGQREVIVLALEKYKKGNANFGDYMILSEGEVYGAPTIATFDQAFCKEVPNSENLLKNKCVN